MKASYRRQIIMALMLCISTLSLTAQERRPIDSQHPMWMIHVDVHYRSDPQKIINLVPEDIRPFVCFNLSLSCGYDKERKVFMYPQNGVLTLRSWATVCQQNGVWFTCQPASGGHCHIKDADVETFESFYKDFPNFLGWNFAEQFWGFDEEGDESSAKMVERLALFAQLVPMAHQYGGFLTISYCGNIWSQDLNPMGMMKQNSNLYKACKNYPEAILFLFKYTTATCWYNNESMVLGPFIAGLAKNYGVRYDTCGWASALTHILGEGNGCTVPTAAGICTVLEQTAVNGACVWDGPELTWAEDFKEIDKSTVGGYTQRNWSMYPQLMNAWIDSFRKILDGTIYIPTREEVVQRTKVVVINDIQIGSSTDKNEVHASWQELYDGLYKQTDPFNRNDGYWMDNCLFFKKTGRYAAIPVVIGLNDELANSIPTKIYRSKYKTTWPNLARKVNTFNSLYPEVSKGDLYVSRFKNQLMCYTPYSYLNKKRTATASIPLEYNTCESIDLTLGMLGSGVVREYNDHIDMYLNNYRSDTTELVLETIVVNGATLKPAFNMVKRVSAKAEASEQWDEETKTYTLTISHWGPVDVRIDCTGSAEERKTDTAGSTALETPRQPETYYGKVTIEAEDMNYKNIKTLVTDPYHSHPDIRGHCGNGFIVMGNNTQGGLKHTLVMHHASEADITLRYNNTSGKSGNIMVTVNGARKTLNLQTTETNEWVEKTVRANLKEGNNTIVLNNTQGIDFICDNVTYMPLHGPTTIGDVPVAEERIRPAGYYDLHGVRHTQPVRGVNIVSDGKGNVRKIYHTK